MATNKVLKFTKGITDYSLMTILTFLAENECSYNCTITKYSKCHSNTDIVASEAIIICKILDGTDRETVASASEML